jgi:hypothetical protein
MLERAKTSNRLTTGFSQFVSHVHIVNDLCFGHGIPFKKGERAQLSQRLPRNLCIHLISI